MQRSVLIVPGFFRAATISYATLPSVEMETKLSATPKPHNMVLFTVLFDLSTTHVLRGPAEISYSAHIRLFLAAATASYSLRVIIYRPGEELTLKPQWWWRLWPAAVSAVPAAAPGHRSFPLSRTHYECCRSPMSHPCSEWAFTGHHQYNL